jgi:hypothetical protein
VEFTSTSFKHHIKYPALNLESYENLTFSRNVFWEQWLRQGFEFQHGVIVGTGLAIVLAAIERLTPKPAPTSEAY